VILGGGEDYWYPEGDPGAFPDEPEVDPEEKSAGTQGDLVQQAQEAGYEYVTDASELGEATGPQVLGLFANEEMFQQAPEGEGDVYDPVVSLPEMTEKAIEVLSADPGGFFLMVEEEGIDEMAHQSNAERVIEAGRQLDAAVEVGKSFAQENAETLLIVTADHETGSFAIEDINELQNDPDYPNETGEGRTAQDGPFPVANSDDEFVVDWTTSNHTAEDVPLTAMGPGGENLVGTYENTHIHDALVDALALGSVEVAPGAQPMPETGGPSLGISPIAAALALLACAAALAIVPARRLLSRR
jgi:alkaline phosphatase